jgi:hypothetical protein
MSSFDPLGLRPNDPLERYREDAERREREFARARRQREREERRAAEAAAANEAVQLRAKLEGRIAALEVAHKELRADLLEVARATREAVEQLADQRMDLSREQREEIRELKVEVAKLGSTLTELREQRAKDQFQFAREKDAGEIEDLPNPLPLRRDLN